MPDLHIPLASERATLNKRVTRRGVVRVKTKTEWQRSVIPVHLLEDAVDIQHVPIDRLIEDMPAIREENGVTIIPVVKEVATLTIQRILVKEIHLIPRRVSRTVEVPVTLREQTVSVEQHPPSQGDPDDV